jgi:drug/metabolite transporter (DMT)-like permease
MTPRTAGLTGVAMFAFAANSLLCRLALGSGHIDAASFTTVRLAAGAAVLGLCVLPRWRAERSVPTDWAGTLCLFAYMIAFSFAYLSLTAATGALVLFGTVQMTMFAAALLQGEPFPPRAWFGFALAVAGLVYLMAPGLQAPAPGSAALMMGAGVSWGLYSLLGRRAGSPLMASAGNFLAALPLALAANLLFVSRMHASWVGIALAAASGAAASGLGYVVWYAALQSLPRTIAATVQLSVPVLAAWGGVALLAEPLSSRLVLAAVMTLGGVATVLISRGTAR